MRKFIPIAAVTGAVWLATMGASVAGAATTPAPAPTACVQYGPAGTHTSKGNVMLWNWDKQPCQAGTYGVTIAMGAGTGIQGPAGPAGPAGATGPAGASGLDGAYYSVAKYDVGDTNGGAVATVACKATTDVAISGGVQTLALGTNGLTGNVPVSSSFPGRMDWSTNTPKPGDLSGWIVQFGGNSSSTSLGDPHYVDIYALCVPAATIPVDPTYSESGS